MKTKTPESTTSGKARSFTVCVDADLMARIEQHRAQVQQQTGMRVSLSQATVGLVRRGFETIDRA
ncbi:conserved hypothetical protein [Paraburkholderia tropica]|uniref:hypothetical protein n=1 Tax=Paraburkholderia tropica TaxID=92647 RepID=UPI001CAB2190|nr:hypothetical protein [Paraburkholderia tropica]CAG9239335.1 conserved hypothetical protein [Paraburkholderia tropica]